jgi:carboxylesterase type B
MADQRLALRWTYRNIEAFGGDPSSVTLFGESAGAFSVMYHLVSPPSWPYFSKAIVQSGTSRSSWFFQPKFEAEELYSGWASAVGCQPGLQQLSCLQALPARSFADAPPNYTGWSPVYGLFPFGPVVDGTLYGLIDVPIKLITVGRFHKVPLIVGSNKDGGSFFVPALFSLVPGAEGTFPKNKTENERALDFYFGPLQTHRLWEVYPDEDYTSAEVHNTSAYSEQFAQMVRDGVFMCSTRAVARHWAMHGAKVFVYTFAFDLGELDKYFLIGDAHAFDVPFVWSNLLGFLRSYAEHQVYRA